MKTQRCWRSPSKRRATSSRTSVRERFRSIGHRSVVAKGSFTVVALGCELCANDPTRARALLETVGLDGFTTVGNQLILDDNNGWTLNGRGCGGNDVVDRRKRRGGIRWRHGGDGDAWNGDDGCGGSGGVARERHVGIGRVRGFGSGGPGRHRGRVRRGVDVVFRGEKVERIERGDAEFVERVRVRV